MRKTNSTGTLNSLIIRSSEAYKQQEIIDNQEILSIRPLITEHQGAPFKVKLYYGGKPVFLKRYTLYLSL